MARILMTDNGIRFDGRSLDGQPLGGAESAFAELAQALAARGHDVNVRNNCDGPLRHKGVDWAPLSHGLPDDPDVYIANRGDRLLPLAPKAGRRIFWIHNPAGYLLKWRYQWKLARYRPVIVFSGASHLSTYPGWAFDGGREIIPLGITDLFRHGIERTEAPPPRAIFTSNPLRSLDWLVDVWAEAIRPHVPGAELHVFAGKAVYGAAGDAKAARMQAVLDKAEALKSQGVILRGPVAKEQLVAELAQARAFLYRGDIGETFCNAAAEAQAMGVPGVVEDIACMAERFQPGRTGFVVTGRQAFAEAARRLLTDDALWLAQHRAALATRGGLSWDEVAARFERLFG